MENIKNVLTNTFYFKIVATVVLLAATVEYISIVYEFGIYIVVLWGCLLLIYNTFKGSINYKKIDALVLIFIIGYLITIFNNSDSNIVKQAFVLMCCLMYFFLFFSSDQESDIRLYRENFVVMHIIIVFSFILLLLSYIVFFYDMLSGTNHTYNLHGGTQLQFQGLYVGLATNALISGISAAFSLGFLFQWKEVKSNRIRFDRTFKIFHIVNFLIQLLSVIISFTSAGIVALGVSLIIGCFIFIYNSMEHRTPIKIIIGMLISIILVICCLSLMTWFGNKTINYGVNINNNFSESIKADESISGLNDSNGRIEIWKDAINQWKDNYIFGNGYGTFHTEFVVNTGSEKANLEYSNIHSGYIEVLYTCGICGFISIMIFGLYYVFKYLKFIFTKKSNKCIGMTMVIVQAGLYAAINQLFILDRSISVFLLCLFLGIARKTPKHEIKKV